MAGPCAWDVDPEALGVCAGWAELPEETRINALALATMWMWGATGRRFGPCPVTVRPGQGRGAAVAYQEFVVAPGTESLGVLGGPYLFGGRWFNSGCSVMCCGASACAIVLRGPVYSIDQVLVDGDVVPSSAYRVDVIPGAWLLVRVDGQCWPACQNFTAETSEPGTFEVAYDIGEQIPDALALATALLACEYSKALIPGATCSLPAKMTRISRQGVEIEVAPPDPAKGRTGIKAVDDVITALNPGGLRQPPRVLSPDLPESCDRFTVIGAGS
jgi:hypothetical protein